MLPNAKWSCYHCYQENVTNMPSSTKTNYQTRQTVHGRFKSCDLKIAKNRHFLLPFSPSDRAGVLALLCGSGDPAAELGLPDRVLLKNRFMSVLERWRVTFFSVDTGFSFFCWRFSSRGKIQVIISDHTTCNLILTTTPLHQYFWNLLWVQI